VGNGGPVTVPGPYWYHMVTEEIRNAIAGAGITPDSADLNQLHDALAAVLTNATRFTQPGPNGSETTVQAALGERVSLARNLSLVEIMSVEAGLGALDLTEKLQETIQYAKDIGGRVIEAFPGVFKCNIELFKGVILQGSGRGQEVNFGGPIPQTSNYAFAGGGSTFIPADRALPTIKTSGSGGADGWPVFCLRDLKLSDVGGAVVNTTIGLLAELSSNFELHNVEIRNMGTGLKIGSPGKTSWSWSLSTVTIADCKRGIDASAATQNAAPQVMYNVDVRRCTEYGAKFDQFCCLGWYGGTIADNLIGAIVLGDTNGQGVVAFHDLQWETNLQAGLVVGGSGRFPGGPVVVCGGQFADYRGTAGDGSAWPSVYAGSVAIDYNVNEPTSRLVLRGVSFVTVETCIQYAGNGIVTRDACRLYQCTRWGQVFQAGSLTDQMEDEYSAVKKDGYVGFGFGRFRYSTNDFTTYGNNFYLMPANLNGANVAGLLPNGTGTFSQWGLHAGSDPDNSSFVALEASATYGYLYTGKRGSGVAQKLVIQKPGGVISLYEASGVTQLAGWGNPTNGAIVANFNASTATLGQCAQVLAMLLAHWKQRGDLAA
jgi:hypothetical protein